MDENESGKNQENPPSTPFIKEVTSIEGGIDAGQKQDTRRKILEYIQSKWQENRENWKRLNAMEKFTGMLVLFTAIYASISLWQGCQTRNAVGVARDTLDATIKRDRLDQRAWVGPVMALLPKISVGSTVTFGFVVKNSGKTPALGYRSRQEVKTVPKGTPFVATYSGPTVKQGGTVLYPGMEVRAGVTTDNPINQGQIQAWSSGDEILHIYGEIFYRDIFDCSYRATFCVFLSPELSDLLSCRTYNEVEEMECKKKDKK